MKQIITTCMLFCFLVAIPAQKKVLLDNFYNFEINSKTGKAAHYTWDDLSHGGFSEFGALFTQQGAELLTLKSKPTYMDLKQANIYIIVDPDHVADNNNPNYMDKKTAAQIAKWVKNGGVLLLLTNDSVNCDLNKINLLSAKFGIIFNNDRNHPELRGTDKKTRNFQSCASENLPVHPVFESVKKIFIKEISSLSCKNPAKAVLVENNKIFMAEAKYGKGYVFAVGDPWLYNEYIDHAILPDDFQNKKAAENLVKWLLDK